MHNLTIPKPCHEDWNGMSPVNEGRHCSSCAKTVVDFTAMSDEEIKYFFMNRSSERVCGRFRDTQLQRVKINIPENIFSTQMPVWKCFLAACLLVFGTTLFSCNTSIEGTKNNTIGEPIEVTTGKPFKATDTVRKPIPPAKIPVCITTHTTGIVAPPMMIDSIVEVPVITSPDSLIPAADPANIIKGEVGPAPVKKKD